MAASKKQPRKTIDRYVYYPPLLFDNMNKILSNKQIKTGKKQSLNSTMIALAYGFESRNKKYLKPVKRKK